MPNGFSLVLVLGRRRVTFFFGSLGPLGLLDRLLVVRMGMGETLKDLFLERGSMFSEKKFSSK